MDSIAALYKAIQLLKARAILFVEPILVIISAVFAVIGLVQIEKTGSIIASTAVACVLIIAVEILNVYSAIAFRLAKRWGKLLPFLGFTVCSLISIAMGELFWQSLAAGQADWVRYSFTAFAAICPLFLIYVEATKKSFEEALLEVATTKLQNTNSYETVHNSSITVLDSSQTVEQNANSSETVTNSSETEKETVTTVTEENDSSPKLLQKRSDTKQKIINLLTEHGESYIRENSKQIGKQLGCSNVTVLRHLDRLK